LNLDPAVAADSQVATLAESSRSVVPAQAGTHPRSCSGSGNGILACAGMTVWNPCTALSPFG
ncbi:MAG: hypothetical protein ACLPX9_13745, partial [Rhodomicrobium sp.]